MLLIWTLVVAALVVPLATAFGVLVHPPLFDHVRAFLIPLAVAGLLATAAGAWLLWWRS